jgi:probable HAF family extracellular repeat protein
MKRHLGLALAAAFAACVDTPRPVGITADAEANASGSPQQVQYQWTPLDTRGDGFRSYGLAINNRDEVVGWATMTPDRLAPLHAVLWAQDTIQDLGTLGGMPTQATAINERGQVGGFATTSTNGMEAFFWDNGTMQDLGPVSGDRHTRFPVLGSPIHFNERGQVVGNRPGGGSFLWEDGVAQALPLDVATDINNRGQVVGWILTPDATGTLQRHAALWEAGALTDLGTLGGPSSWAVAITNSGSVLGTSYTEPRSFCSGQIIKAADEPFRWRDGVIEDLGTVLTCTSQISGLVWEGQYINERGQVVAAELHNGCATGVWDDGVWERISGCIWASGMNATGAVTGGRGGSTGCCARTVPFVWQAGVQQDLGTGSNLNGIGQGINDRGVVVGATWDGTNLFATRAAMWVWSRGAGPPVP